MRIALRYAEGKMSSLEWLVWYVRRKEEGR